MGSAFGVPEDLDEEELMGELDALEDDLAAETTTGGSVPAYLQVRRCLHACACVCLLCLCEREREREDCGGGGGDVLAGWGWTSAPCACNVWAGSWL